MKTVLFFTQTSCAPCRRIEPTIKDLCMRYGVKLQYIRVDTPEGKQLAQQAGEFTTPAVIVLDSDGKELGKLRNETPILQGLEKKIIASKANPNKGFVFAGVGAACGYAVSKKFTGLLFGAIVGDLASSFLPVERGSTANSFILRNTVIDGVKIKDLK